MARKFKYSILRPSTPDDSIKTAAARPDKKHKKKKKSSGSGEPLRDARRLAGY